MFKHKNPVMQGSIETKMSNQILNMSIYSPFHTCGAASRAAAAAAPWEEKVWLTALRSPPLSPPSLLEREEVKCTPSNKHTRMPMQNTLPSLLATAIFLKLVSSRAPEASLSLELLGLKWTDDRAGKHISVQDQVCSPMNTFNASTSKCFLSSVFWKEGKHSARIPPTFICHQISWNPVTQKRALQTLWDQPLWKHNSTFTHRKHFL